jgi:hypothetical protein
MSRLILLIAALLLLPPAAAAQPPTGGGQAGFKAPGEEASASFLSKRNQLSIDATAIGASVSFAHGGGTGKFVGVCVGVGGDFFNYMAIAGRHFAQGVSYEPKDGNTDKRLFDVAHLGLFLRNQPTDWCQYDVGLRGSVFLHWDSSDDDPGAGDFLGGYGALYFGGRHFKVGPRLLVGRFRCTGGASEFGVIVSPVTVRIGTAW